MVPDSVKRFQEYLRIKSVHPTPDYWGCVDFLVGQAKEIGLEHKVVECVKDKPVVILTLPGTNPSLKSILLNSHTDVVPVYEEHWNYPPFGAERVLQENGDHRIYARGAQDMKVTGSMYLEALREIKNSGKQLVRNVHAMFVPEEELGGKLGMAQFVKSDEFKALNGGFGLDEGALSFNEYTFYFTRERTVCWTKYTVHGNVGHGSQLIKDTAVEKLLPIMNTMADFRKQQVDGLNAMEGNPLINQGHFTSVNMTMIEGGQQPNVIPATYSLVVDMHISADLDANENFKWQETLAAEHGADLEFINRVTSNVSTVLDDTNPFMNAFKTVCKRQNRIALEAIMPAATDAQYVRNAGIPAIGVNPMRNHPPLVHDHNEYVNESEFLEGIPFYVDMIQELANITE
ncbi:hypothetical protein BB559_001325 [Furculomyces boomerangus]|uniref:N-acyl-aliphatic-L-amino acid amidohydrolase n=1 Tax=Furculomyces boomerangus TaxID=61424 RepID=A0A2T9Z2C2_9FUNG|nr:hypothetical protein BB559_001325 [Furculomyces boomerangus]